MMMTSRQRRPRFVIRRCLFSLWILLLFVIIILASATARVEAFERRDLFLLDSVNEATTITQQHYDVYMALFGDQMKDERIFHLMLPPRATEGNNDENENALCVLPEASTSTSGIITYNSPIGLLLPYDERKCTAQRQASIALRVQQQQQGFPSLQYLLLHGTNESTGYGKEVIVAENYPYNETFNQLGIVYLPLEHVPDIQKRIQERVEQGDKNNKTTVSPYLGDPDSQYWSFKLKVSGRAVPDIGEDDSAGYFPTSGDYDGEKEDGTTANGRINDGSRSSVSDDSSFYWFRFMLFGLLIITPCFRAAYLWYKGDYRQPIPFWSAALGVGRQQQQQDDDVIQQQQTTLTEEQFACLPEITYKPDDVVSAIADAANAAPARAAPAPAAPAVDTTASLEDDEKEEDNEASEPTNVSTAAAAKGVATSNSPPLAAVVEPSSTQKKDSIIEPELLLEEPPPTVVPAAPRPPRNAKDLEQQLSVDDSEATNNNNNNIQIPIAMSTSIDDDESDDNDAALLSSTATTTNTANNHQPDDTADAVVAVAADAMAAAAAPALATTISTECCICFDDFKAGETLTLLPRCRHAFHKDCIRKWILETKKGRCPCRTSVLVD